MSDDSKKDTFKLSHFKDILSIFSVIKELRSLYSTIRAWLSDRSQRALFRDPNGYDYVEFIRYVKKNKRIIVRLRTVDLSVVLKNRNDGVSYRGLIDTDLEQTRAIIDYFHCASIFDDLSPDDQTLLVEYQEWINLYLVSMAKGELDMNQPPLVALRDRVGTYLNSL